jgi:hypothetical protein
MRISVTIIICLTFFSVCRAQENVGKDKLINRLRDIRTAVQSLNSPSTIVIRQRNDLRLLLSDIIIRLDGFKGQFPKDYLLSLDKSLMLTTKMNTLDTAAQVSELFSVYRDLNLKFKDRPNTLGAQLFNGLLSVSVICRRNGKEVHDLRVRYASLGYALRLDHPDGSFPSLTSPAKGKLVPGYYQVWVTQDGAFSVLRSWSGEISPESDNSIQFNLP